jgi:hypothetical protein
LILQFKILYAYIRFSKGSDYTERAADSIKKFEALEWVQSTH